MFGRPAVLLWLLCTASGCFLDRSGNRPEPEPPIVDAGASDGYDAGYRIDAGFDAATFPHAPDGGSAELDGGFTELDSGANAELDAGLDSGLDAGSDAGSDAGLSTCATHFGGVRRFELCDSAMSACSFYSDPLGRHTCREICEMAGASCIESYDDAPPVRCPDRPESPTGCDAERNDQVCVCSRP